MGKYLVNIVDVHPTLKSKEVLFEIVDSEQEASDLVDTFKSSYIAKEPYLGLKVSIFEYIDPELKSSIKTSSSFLSTEEFVVYGYLRRNNKRVSKVLKETVNSEDKAVEIADTFMDTFIDNGGHVSDKEYEIYKVICGKEILIKASKDPKPIILYVIEKCVGKHPRIVSEERYATIEEANIERRNIVGRRNFKLEGVSIEIEIVDSNSIDIVALRYGLDNKHDMSYTGFQRSLEERNSMKRHQMGE